MTPSSKISYLIYFSHVSRRRPPASQTREAKAVVTDGLADTFLKVFLFCYQASRRLATSLFAVTPRASAHSTLIQDDVTKVTFTVGPTGHRMITWFGSSGGGLPGGVLSVSLKALFLVPGLQSITSLLRLLFCE